MEPCAIYNLWFKENGWWPDMKWVHQMVEENKKFIEEARKNQ